MEPFEIFITYISWRSAASQRPDGKNRPVLVLMASEEKTLVYPITTQYENKSDVIKARCFKITDWPQCGLDRQSYIDTGILLNFPISIFENRKPIGKLTTADKNRLLAFLQKR
jgi:hypothetical protein